MHRSTSTTRVTDDHYSYYSSSPSSSKIPTALRALTQGSGDLPLYEPLSEAAKKERNKAKFAENAVHLIPLVLFICALVLWFFSNPVIDVKGNSIIAAKIEGMGSDQGHLDSDGTGHLPVELGDMDPAKLGDANTLFSQNRS